MCLRYPLDSWLLSAKEDMEAFLDLPCFSSWAFGASTLLLNLMLSAHFHGPAFGSFPLSPSGFLLLISVFASSEVSRRFQFYRFRFLLCETELHRPSFLAAFWAGFGSLTSQSFWLVPIPSPSQAVSVVLLPGKFLSGQTFWSFRTIFLGFLILGYASELGPLG